MRRMNSLAGGLNMPFDEHGGNIYEFKKKGKSEIIDFSANINPLGLPKGLKEVLFDNFGRILHYPDLRGRELTGKIARYWGLNEENILLGNGSVELIYLVFYAFRPETTFIPMPVFSEYECAARNTGSEIRFLKLKEKKGFKIDMPSSPKADMAFICNPNNPTGNLVLENQRAFERLVDKLLVVDEAFMDFLPGQKKHTLMGEVAKKRKIAVLRTFTKFFALPGLRIGYIAAHKEVIRKLRQYQPPWSANSLAQLAAQLMLDDKEYANKTRYLIEQEREFLFERLSAIEGLKPYSSVANFLLIRIEKCGMTSQFLTKELIKKGIFVRDCGNFRDLRDKYIRVAVRSRGENEKLINALEEVL